MLVINSIDEYSCIIDNLYWEAIIVNMAYLIITNNPKVYRRYGERFHTQYLPDSYLDVLIRIRDALHSGCRLLTHPMAGSLKPNQTPFRSAILEGNCGQKQSWDDLILIENSITAYHKFTAGRATPDWTEKIRDDFATIDLSFMESAVGNASISKM